MRGKARTRVAVGLAMLLGMVGLLVGPQPVQATPASVGATVGAAAAGAAQEAVVGTKTVTAWSADKGLHKLEAPVTASGTIYGCPSDYFCLYKWINYDGGRWQYSFVNHQGSCWNLSGSTYTTGGNVNNTAGSMIMNIDIDPEVYAYWTFRVYDWVNCNDDGDWMYTYMDGTDYTSNLSNVVGWTSTNMPSWYHKPTSVQLGPPPIEV